MTAIHDVAIIGGGLVGASLAIALEGSGLDVAMVEAAPAGAMPAVFDERNLSFAEATVNALAALGVMQRLRAPTGAIVRIHASRRGDFGRVLLEAAEHGREAFGQVVVARDFGEALEARLSGVAGLVRHRGTRFTGFGAVGDGCRVLELAGEGPPRMRARLVVAADGATSGVRDALGIGASRHDYGQVLMVARLRAARAPDGTAYERLGDDGPTALLPRGDRAWGLVHGVAAADAEAVKALDETGFLARVQDAFGWRVGRLLSVGPRSAYPAVAVRAAALAATRAVLVGNAAQSIHPVGAQGFNLGLRDALTLAGLLVACARRGGDPGEASLLSAYVARREEDRRRTLEFSDGLARITANPGHAASLLRSAGLVALAALPSLRAGLVGGAMGYRGDVPDACRSGAAR
ncbi:2-octaprenyl-6-methoxyphenyl hydroxylase [Luteimonas granuli]|uniref:2-octaprenyl-6-methoxyphenyl hydroxylase n=1 Tax=Luteimonas granuli TaxID=1176533 RepID=A0A518N5T4_9GAMM|nr:2-octaprenyl-6-methoxyphenyl hydroxylase [Luteimonas granuli]QDW67247.1 2-octaprenyl-6-methoxyphenyl hydroxylase [Luteimonas granuli]